MSFGGCWGSIPICPLFSPTQRSPIFIKIGQLDKKRKTEARSDHIERFDPNSPHKAQGAQVLPLPQSEGEFSPANILLCGGLHCYSPCPEIQWCPSCLECPVRLSVWRKLPFVWCGCPFGKNYLFINTFHWNSIWPQPKYESGFETRSI